MNQSDPKGKGAERGDERKKRVIGEEEDIKGSEDDTRTYSELMNTLNSLSKKVKDGKFATGDSQSEQSSMRSTPSYPPTPSSSKNVTAANHTLICDSLDNLITHYLVNYASGTAEDKLMKSDLENVRSYLRRKKKQKQEEMKRHEVNRPTAQRFLMNGIRSTINSPKPPPESTGAQDQDKSDHHKKSKLNQSQSTRLPEIRQVIKNPQDDADDDQDDDADLKIYED